MGMQQREPVSGDLEKAAEEYATSVDFAGNKTIVGNEVDAFKAGAKWQKEKDESATKDLGDYINEFSKQFPEVSFAKLSRIAVRVAKWQKEQDFIVAKDCEEAAIEICSKVLEGETVVIDGYEYVVLSDAEECVKAGAKWQMAQMIKDATDVTVHVEAGNYPYIPQLELYDYDKDIPLAKEGDKYKVVLIKE